MNYKTLLFNVLVFFLSLNSFSQTEYQVELQDAETLEPISYATIRFKGTNRGLVADYEGQLRLPIDLISIYEVLEVSALGYETFEIVISSLESGKVNKFIMQPRVESLEEVVIEFSNTKRRKKVSDIVRKSKLISAYDIVYKAVREIPLNLKNSPHSYIGYYRDYQIINDTYYNLKEGILEQFDKGIGSFHIVDDNNQSAFYSFKRNLDFATNMEAEKAYNGKTKYIEGAKLLAFGGNELSILNAHNPIRNYNRKTFSFVNRMNIDFLAAHKFTKGKIIYNDNEPIIEINFINIEDHTSISHSVLGKLKISLEDFAVYSFSYTVHDNKKINPLFSIQTEYKRQNDNMFLNYITFNNRFVTAEKDVFKETKIVYDRANHNFEVTFNSDLDPESIKKRNFKIKYKDRKVSVKDIERIDSKNIRLSIDKFYSGIQRISKNNKSELEFVIIRLKDVKGREIYKPRTFISYQFREFFVQEVFENKLLDDNLNFINKQQPLDKSSINKTQKNERYIINSPLKSTRTN